LPIADQDRRDIPVVALIPKMSTAELPKSAQGKHG